MTPESPEFDIARMGTFLAQAEELSPDTQNTMLDLIHAKRIDEALAAAMPMLEGPRRRQLLCTLRNMAGIAHVKATNDEEAAIQIDCQLFIVPVYGPAGHLLAMTQNPRILGALSRAVEASGFLEEDNDSRVVFHSTILDPVEAMATTPGVLFDIVNELVRSDPEEDPAVRPTSPAVPWLGGPVDIRLLVGLRMTTVPEDTEATPDFFSHQLEEQELAEVISNWNVQVRRAMNAEGLALQCGFPLEWNESIYQAAMMQFHTDKTAAIEAMGLDIQRPHDTIHTCVLADTVAVKIQHQGHALDTIFIPLDALTTFMPSFFRQMQMQGESVIDHADPVTFPDGKKGVKRHMH